jgi:hypothetical protein
MLFLHSLALEDYQFFTGFPFAPHGKIKIVTQNGRVPVASAQHLVY